MKKTNINFFTAVFFVLFLIIQGCSPNSTVPIIPLKQGEITANISGSGKFYTTNALADSGNVTYHVHSSVLDSNRVDSLVLDILVTKKSPVPYSVDISTDGITKISYCIIKPDGSCKTYNASQGTGSASIRISDISPTLQGTFNATVVLVGGTESLSVSNGEFNAGYN